MGSAAESVPLLEQAPITDIYTDGTHCIEVCGVNVRIIYFRWRLIEGVWRRVAAEFARVCPMQNLPIPLEKLPGITVHERKEIRLHS